MILENMNEKQINLNNEIGNILVNQNKINKKLELTNEFLKKLFLYCELEVKKYNKIIKYTVDKAIYCEDEYENPYLFVEFNPFGNLLVSLMNNETLLISPKTNIKQKNINKNNEYIIDVIGYKLFEKQEYEYITHSSKNKKSIFKNNRTIAASLNENKRADILKQKIINLDEYIKDKNNVNILSKNQNVNINERTIPTFNKESPESSQIEMIFADVELEHSWWFKGLRNDFGYTEPNEWYPGRYNKGLCHFIAMSILLQYSQLFYSDKTFDEDQLKKYSTTYNQSDPDRDRFDYVTVDTFNKKIPFDLWEKYNHGFATTHLDVVKIMKSFFSENKNGTPIDFQTRVWGWIKPWKWIRDNKPTIIMGNDFTFGYHAIMPYGYYNNENKYLVHYGWEGYSQVIMSSSFLFETWLVGIYQRKNISNSQRFVHFQGRKMSLEEYEKFLQEKYGKNYPFEHHGGGY